MQYECYGPPGTPGLYTISDFYTIAYSENVLTLHYVSLKEFPVYRLG
jgi:hypothetical protein